MRRWIRFEGLVLLPCIAVTGLSSWVVLGYPERVEMARRSPPPEGGRYLDTCDGRPTSLVGGADSRCLADYPGEFGRNVLSVLSAAFFLLSNLAYWLLRRRDGGSAMEPG